MNTLGADTAVQGVHRVIHGRCVGPTSLGLQLPSAASDNAATEVVINIRSN
ncbi:MAG: hypothetical protein JWM62_1950 [Frankiales bacterium]|nr:hypothetical protein [Frankiales bacterium]